MPNRPPPGGGGGDEPNNQHPDLPAAWQALLNYPGITPALAKYVTTSYAANPSEAGYTATLTYVTAAIQAGIDAAAAPASGFPAPAPFDPWLNGIQNAYYQLWGDEIPKAEISYAEKNGLNVYEFIDYQRSKESFKRTDVYQREAVGRAGALMDAFGFGGGFTGSAYPVTGAGTI